jgi:hypothetical protein
MYSTQRPGSRPKQLIQRVQPEWRTETRRKEFASPASKCTGQLEKAVGHKGNFTVKSVVGSDNGPPLSDSDASHHRVDRLAHERGHDRVQVRQRRQRVEDVQIGSV